MATLHDDLIELHGMTHGPAARVNVLMSRIRAALDGAQAELAPEHKELFVASFLLFEKRQHGGVSAADWERLWNATSGVSKLLGVASVSDVHAMDSRSPAQETTTEGATDAAHAL